MPDQLRLDVDATALDRAADVLGAGGVVVLPTDTVYGVAASPSVPGATARLAALKVRPVDQPLAVLVADVDQALALCEAQPPDVIELVRAHWPGPLTLVLRRSASAAGLALGGSSETIGVRCPDHGFVRSLAALVGPIATTSANRHGEPSPVDAAGAAAALDGPVDLIVDGGPAGTVASTVVDATVAPWSVLRHGALDEAALRS